MSATLLSRLRSFPRSIPRLCDVLVTLPHGREVVLWHSIPGREADVYVRAINKRSLLTGIEAALRAAGGDR